ncbi:MAG: hypothetical protein OEX09_04205, partial [Candidatus Bathyarchaeota archaeon]|nr:hypothetical protein [Candidatus Bathyarchaeota archaeon]
MDFENPFTVFGVTLILIGIALLIIPIIGKIIPTVDVQKIPWPILYVYRRNGFVFITSPLLIIIGIASFL